MSEPYTEAQRSRWKTQLADRAERMDKEDKLDNYQLVYTYGVAGEEQLNFGQLFGKWQNSAQYQMLDLVGPGGLCIIARPSDRIYVMGYQCDAPWLLNASEDCVLYLGEIAYLTTLEVFLEHA